MSLPAAKFFRKKGQKTVKIGAGMGRRAKNTPAIFYFYAARACSVHATVELATIHLDARGASRQRK
jgi:hypothetical protein